MTEPNPFDAYDEFQLIWIAIVIRTDIAAWKAGEKVQHPQYALADCYDQLKQVTAEMERRKEAVRLS